MSTRYESMTDEALKATLAKRCQRIDQIRADIVGSEKVAAHVLGDIHTIKRIMAERDGHRPRTP